MATKKIYGLTHEEAIRALAVMTDRHQDFSFLSPDQVEEVKRQEKAAQTPKKAKATTRARGGR